MPKIIALAFLILPSILFAQEAETATFKKGIRAGVGISQFRSHVAIRVGTGSSAVLMDPAIGLSAGIAGQAKVSGVLSIAPELQYSLYRANYEVIEERKRSLDRAYLTGVYMHALELPILLRFNLANSAYTEIGPQAGLNLYSRIYANADLFSPDINLLALGAVAGAGAKMDRTLLGIRGTFAFTEYAKDAKGIPWSVHISATRFIF